MNQSVHVDTRTNRFVLPPKRLQRDPNKASLNKVLAQKLPYFITNMVGNFRHASLLRRVHTRPTPCRSYSSTDRLSSSKPSKLSAFLAMVDISSLDTRRN